VLLYYITDRKGFPGSESERRTSLLRRIADAARAGVDYIQLREKDLAPDELRRLARAAVTAIRAISATTNLLINSSVDIAIAAGADGVHLPAGSPLPSKIRAAWFQSGVGEPLIGVSAHSVEDVLQAQTQGANFAVLAPIFEKAAIGGSGIGLDALRLACSHGFQVLALGGVTLANARSCLAAGAAGLAGIRLFQQGDIAETVRQLRDLATSRWANGARIIS